MKIDYILDNKLKYIKTVEDGLGKHNKIFTSETISGMLNLYLLEENKIMACIECNHFWDWIAIDKIYYSDFKTLKILFNEVYKKYNGKQNAIYYKTHDKKVLDDLKQVAFKTVGKIEDKPVTFTTEELVDYTMSFNDSIHKYKIVVASKGNDPYKDKFNSAVAVRLLEREAPTSTSGGSMSLS